MNQPQKSTVSIRTYQKGEPGYEIVVVSGATEEELHSLVDLAHDALAYALSDGEGDDE